MADKYVLVEQLKALKYSDREIKDAVYLVNLLFFSPEYIYDYKKELTRTRGDSLA